MHPLSFDYQSERHCSKTRACRLSAGSLFDYQSERHCSKTAVVIDGRDTGLITSQNDTAPKLIDELGDQLR